MRTYVTHFIRFSLPHRPFFLSPLPLVDFALRYIFYLHLISCSLVLDKKGRKTVAMLPLKKKPFLSHLLEENSHIFCWKGEKSARKENRRIDIMYAFKLNKNVNTHISMYV